MTRPLLLVLAAALAFAGRAQADLTRAPTEREMDQLPDMTDPTLTCGACRAAVTELQEALQQARTRKRGRLSEVEMIEATEDVCDTRMGRWGLQMRNNEITNEYSRDERIARASGNWLTTKLVNTCGEVLGDYEDDVFGLFNLRNRKAARTICVEVGRFCRGDVWRKMRFDERDVDEHWAAGATFSEAAAGVEAARARASPGSSGDSQRSADGSGDVAGGAEL